MKRPFHPILWVIILTAPLMLWAKVLILPTFDDWFTLSSPNRDPDFMQYFLPYGSSWRPFDTTVGYIYGWIGSRWFPLLSHLLIFAAHSGSALLIYKICENLRFGRLAQAVATTFFFLSPCMLATIFACDSLNQTYSHFWGLMAIWIYLNVANRWRHPLWLACVLMAVLSKENGLAWAVVPPILAFGFGYTDHKTLIKHLSYGCTLAVVYAVVRLSLPLTEVYYEEYHTLFVLSKKLKAIAILLCYTFLPGDYIYLYHEPSRNVMLFLLTLIPTLPFIAMLFFGKPRMLLNRHFITLAVCAFISVSPNLLITMSMMNAYAWLGMASLMVGSLISLQRLEASPNKLIVAFILFLVATAYTDVHHWYCTWKTSLPSHYMAQQAIEKTGRRVEKVYVITIEEQQKKFSSFCTLPTEAFGWGRAVWGETDFRWPDEIKDTIVAFDTKRHVIDSIAAAAFHKGYECVWIVEKDQVNVLTDSIKGEPL